MKPYIFTGIAGIAAITLTGCSGKSKGTNNNPNIVFILADDLGYNDLKMISQRIQMFQTNFQTSQNGLST